MLTGSLVAMVTPMHPDGSVHWQELDALIDWHVEQGTNGIVAVGTTGESATLEVGEHLEVIDACVKRAAGRVPVIAGTGANSTVEAVHLTQEAERIGADYSLLVTPYYNRPTQAGLIAHYEQIAAKTKLPLVLYNVPPRTACDMSAETVATLARVDNIVAIKEACGDPERVGLIRELAGDDFILLSGEDAQTMRMTQLGAVGTITVTANVLPKLMAEFMVACNAGDAARAAELDARLQPVHSALFIESSPQPTKWALAEMGLISTGIRLPLLPLSDANQGAVRAALEGAGAL
ncbi:MAG: 4-hydroxy-tetrahydrodipicolinate synthase [Pseudomonadota bacterium]